MTVWCWWQTMCFVTKCKPTPWIFFSSFNDLCYQFPDPDTVCCVPEREHELLKLNVEVLAWLSLGSEVQMICIRYSWCHCHPIILCIIKIQNASLSDVGLPRLLWKKATDWTSACLLTTAGFHCTGIKEQTAIPCHQQSSEAEIPQKQIPSSILVTSLWTCMTSS